MFTNNTDLISNFGYTVDIKQDKNLFSFCVEIMLYDKSQEPLKSWYNTIKSINQKFQLYITVFVKEKHLSNFELYITSETEKTVTFDFYVEYSNYNILKNQQQYIKDIFEKYKDYELKLLDLKKHVNALRLDIKNVQ